MVDHFFAKRELRFWEVYMDQIQLASYIADKFKDVVVSTFSLPEWDFIISTMREKFKKLIQAEKRHFIWMVSICTKWSPMQRINMKSDMETKQLETIRTIEMKSHLSVVASRQW